MEVICLEDTAFYTLVEQVVAGIKEKQGIKEEKWISAGEAMKKLRITSKTTLQKLRDERKIRFSQLEKKVSLRQSSAIGLTFHLELSKFFRK